MLRGDPLRGKAGVPVAAGVRVCWWRGKFLGDWVVPVGAVHGVRVDPQVRAGVEVR